MNQQERDEKEFETWFKKTVEPAMVKAGYGLITRIKEQSELEVAFQAGVESERKRSAGLVEAMEKIADDFSYNAEARTKNQAIVKALKQYRGEE